MAVDKRRSKAHEDFVTNRILVLFTGAFLLVLGLMVSYRGYAAVGSYVFTGNALRVLTFVGVGFIVACVVWAIVAARRGVENGYKLLTPLHCTIAAVGVTCCSFFGWQFATAGIMFMYAIVPGTAALLLVYLLYPRDFFGIATVSTAAGVLLWYLNRSTGAGFIWERGVKAGKPMYLVIAAVMLLVAYVVANIILRGKRGTIVIRNVPHEIYVKTARYRLSFITAALAFVCVIAAYICGATVAYYLIYLLVAWLVSLVVYYTVKMI